MKNSFFSKNLITNIYEDTSHKSKISSQILYGEKFKILKKNKKWIKIKTSFDNYNGFIKKINYTSNYNPTHKTFKLKTKIYKKKLSGKMIKTNHFLPFASRISIIDKDKNFVKFDENRWIAIKDINEIRHKEKDYKKMLNLFLKTKYIWGGKSYKGIDCSAILQLFFYYNGKFYPRDTKDQIEYSKKSLTKNKFEKGDIIFWKGHVAICINKNLLIHAYGPKKRVLIMNIKKTINEIEQNANLKIIKKTKLKWI